MTGLDFSPRMLERARAKLPTATWVEGDLLALPFEDGSFESATVGFGVRNVADLPRALARAPPRARRRAAALAILEITQPRGVLAPFYRVWFDRIVPLLGKVLKGGAAYSYLPGERAPLPRPGRARRADARRRGFADVQYRTFAGGIVALHIGQAHDVSALATIRETPGLIGLPRRARGAAAGDRALARRARRSRVAGRALTPAASGCARCSSSSRSPPDAPPSVAAGVAVELVHMATLVHDDLIDGAEFRRGRASAWSAYGPAAARATGDYLFARAFAELAATGDARAVSLLADARSASPAARRCSAARRTTRTRRSRPISSAAR